MSSSGQTYRTEQEAFWAGDFGTEYIQRNQGDALLASNLAFFSRCLRAARGLASCIEFGANIGMNLKALRLLRPGLDCHAIEINAEAARLLAEVIPPANVHQGSILEFEPRRTIRYRGQGDRLFRRDFAGEILDRLACMRLVDYGFAYRRDPSYPQDDATWFLLEKAA